MQAFETDAILDDALHLTLRAPVPSPVARRCRVIVLFDAVDELSLGLSGKSFEDIYITDPAFERPPQGELPPVPSLDS